MKKRVWLGLVGFVVVLGFVFGLVFELGSGFGLGFGVFGEGDSLFGKLFGGLDGAYAEGFIGGGVGIGSSGIGIGGGGSIGGSSGLGGGGGSIGGSSGLGGGGSSIGGGSGLGGGGGSGGLEELETEEDVGTGEVTDEENEDELEDELEDEAGGEEGEEIEEEDVGEGEDEVEFDEGPPLYIKAVNPGYTVGDLSNAGEMIEIRKRTSGPISLAGTVVGYTNSSGSYAVLFDGFPENSWMVGESIILRLAGSSPGEPAALRYEGRGIPTNGGVTLLKDGEVLDAVCFRGTTKRMRVTSAEGAPEIPCLRTFDGSRPSTVVFNESLGAFEHVSEYTPVYEEGSYVVFEEEEEESGEGSEDGSEGGFDDESGGEPGGDDSGGSGGGLTSQCFSLEFSEIFTYYVEEKSEQFLELHNVTDERVVLDGCKIRYKSRDYSLTGEVLADGYFVYRPEGFNFTKNPTNFNEVYLVDSGGEVVDVLVYENGQKKGAAYMLEGYEADGTEVWRITYRLTPGAANVYQEFRDCEEGKEINPETGNCVKVAEAKEKTCAVGYFLNVITGRCNKLATAGSLKKASSSSGASGSGEKVCSEGYYLNPETGRCNKIRENNGADYGLREVSEGEYEESSMFVGIIAVIAVVVIGVAYLVYEFRNEIVKIFRKVFRLSR